MKNVDERMKTLVVSQVRRHRITVLGKGQMNPFTLHRLQIGGNGDVK